MPICCYNGLANSKLGNIEESNFAYQKARKAHPTNIQVLNKLGRTYFQLGNYEKARDAFLEALNILPDYFESLVNVTSSYMQLEDYESANIYMKKIKPADMNPQLRKMNRAIKQKIDKVQ